jgi:hypothetical protein
MIGQPARRQVCLAGLAGLSGLALPGAAFAARPGNDPMVGMLRALFTSPEAAARVGEHGLRDGAIVAAPGTIRAQLGAVGGADDLRALIQADFAAGRTVRLGGWVLSRTEALACAYLALSEGS